MEMIFWCMGKEPQLLREFERYNIGSRKKLLGLHVCTQLQCRVPGLIEDSGGEGGEESLRDSHSLNRKMACLTKTNPCLFLTNTMSGSNGGRNCWFDLVDSNE